MDNKTRNQKITKKCGFHLVSVRLFQVVRVIQIKYQCFWVKYRITRMIPIKISDISDYFRYFRYFRYKYPDSIKYYKIVQIFYNNLILFKYFEVLLIDFSIIHIYLAMLYVYIINVFIYSDIRSFFVSVSVWFSYFGYRNI